MAVSAVFMLDGKGKLLISRDFRGDVPVSCVDRFVNIITGAFGARARALPCVSWPDAPLSVSADVDTEAEIKPIIHEEGITYAYVSYNNLYLLAVSRTNVNAMATLYFLHRLVDVFKFYFEVRKRGPCHCGHATTAPRPGAARRSADRVALPCAGA